MIKTWLQTADGTSVIHSSRPVIIITSFSFSFFFLLFIRLFII